MSLSAAMVLWLKRGLVILGLLSVGLFLVVYFWSVAIAEALVVPQLEERGGLVEVESIRARISGVELRVAHYEEANLRVEGLRVICPWSQLWSIREGFAGSVYLEQLSLTVPEDLTASETQAAPMSLEEQVAAIVGILDSLPLQAVDLVVDDLRLTVSDRELQAQVDANLLRGVSGETHVAATLASATMSMEARVKVLGGGAGFALDFVASAQSWEAFQAKHLQPLAHALAEEGAELYVDSLGIERGFLDLSGYARWSALEPDKLSFTVLADLGAAELYLPRGELILQSASAGLASDGVGHLRAYAKGAVDSMRMGSWMQSGGDWALRMEDARLAGEVRLGEALSLSLGHEDWRQLLQGAGVGRFYLEADAVDAELLRAIELPQLPDDLDISMSVEIEGESQLKAWKPVAGEIDMTAKVQEASVASRGLTLKDTALEAHLRIVDQSLSAGTLGLDVAQMDVLGFALDDLSVDVAAQASGVVEVAPIAADFMGGRLRIEAMHIDPQHFEGFNFRVHLDGLELSQLATAVPQFKGEVSGQVSGYLVGAMRDGQPVLTDGRLEIDSESGARLSYDVNGMLTRGMREGSAAYKQYRMAELAFQNLALKQFSIDVFPEGNTTRPFRLELFGESDQNGTIVPVDFNLNVNVDDTAGVMELLRMIQRGELEF